jgi:hypothetical protein
MPYTGEIKITENYKEVKFALMSSPRIDADEKSAIDIETIPVIHDG